MPTLILSTDAHASACYCATCRHATSIEQDEQLLCESSKLGPRLQAAVQARLERKRLLATAQEMLTLYAIRLS
jgi:hypothetical protein